MEPFSKPVLFIDTREQRPLPFSLYKERFQYIVSATLSAGDYSAFGFEDGGLAFERKSLVDLTGSLTHGRARFIRELERLAEYRYAAIIVEASFNEVSGPYKHCKADASSIIGSLQAFQVRYDIDVIFACTRTMAAEIIVKKIESEFYGRR